jgi:drug/metabolite transporter (DMT)-like permease
VREALSRSPPLRILVITSLEFFAMRRSLRRSPAVLLIVACAFWGAATVLNKALLASIAPVTLLVLQLAPSALVLWIMVLSSGSRISKFSLLTPLVLLGIFNPGVSYTLNMIGLARISASVATLLWAAEPLMILGLAAFILREPVTWRLLMIMLLGAVGVALVADVGGSIGDSGNDPLGILLLLSAVLCCAFYTVFSRKLGESVDPLFTVAVQQTAGFAWALALLSANTPFGSVADIRIISPDLLAAAVISGLLYYATAYRLYITALRSVPAAVAGSYFNAIPVFGIGLAYMFLGETLTLTEWGGAGAILISVFALVRLTHGMGTKRPAR